MGLNDPIKQSEMKSLIVQQRVVATGILETWVRPDKWEKVFNGLKLRHWKVLNNYTCSVVRRLVESGLFLMKKKFF